ncbi:methylmalonyl-CoA mutase domain protein [Ancylostoma ceylanicum]|uniref:Methylmalonyl-CoA mutase domain protein n=1 Tax=Ancylostoma ceylanicum TaxID=53326 RepID=A0A0D6LCE8_9BILA|nr:methylmalonyl-CoA mutase domain protein [Ancylostoma ceylanicum]
MRRIIQSTGCEVIHLGHDRSVEEVVNCAIQEDAQAIAMTSYQGGHTEYFKYMYDLLNEKGAPHIRIFGGGGGTILPSEIDELEAYGIERLYHPDHGRELGLQGMINDLVKRSDYPVGKDVNGDLEQIKNKNIPTIARAISAAENFPEEAKEIFKEIDAIAAESKVPVLGITVDPSKRKTGGALLGDRIRMNAIKNDRVYMRSLATRQSNLALSKHVAEAINVLKVANYDLIILETIGNRSVGYGNSGSLFHVLVRNDA